MGNILKHVDYFLNAKIIFRILEDYSCISRDIWEIFLEKDVNSSVDELIKRKQLCCVDRNLFATEAALEKFRLSTISQEQMKINIYQLMGLNDETKDKSLKELDYYPPPGKVRVIVGTNEESNKLMPFLNICIGACPDPQCGGLVVSMLESICLHVTSNEIENRLENTKNGQFSSQLKEIGHQFQMSRLFTERVANAFARYFSDDDDIQIQLQNGVIIIVLSVEARQNSTLQKLCDNLLDTCIRYQSFINDVYAPIEDFGRPRPNQEIKMAVKDTTNAPAIDDDTDEQFS